MNHNVERAKHYAALFASLCADGKDWRYCRPVDGVLWPGQEKMSLGGVVITRRSGGNGWDVES